MTVAIAPPAPSGLADVQSRMAAIRSLLGAGSSSGLTTSSSFGSVLDKAVDVRAAGSDLSVAAGNGSPSGQQVVDLATSYLGTPYVWGGADPATGFDCSGLVQHTFGALGVDLPRVSSEQARAGQPVASLEDARPGDLVAFGDPVDHIGIYAGNGQMVVAPHRGDVVKVQPITTTPTAIRRVLAEPTVAERATDFDALFEAAGNRYGVRPQLLASVARAESNLDPNARSRAGALGLMQLMPATAAGLGVDPLDPAQAVDGAARLLAGHLRRFGSTPLALAAYNAGGAAVERFGGVPPFKETQAYVQRVMAAMGASS